MLNSTNPVSGESLLQNLVRTGHNLERFEAVLRVNARIGLIPDNQGFTALKIALKKRQKQVVRMLLSTMLHDAHTFPTALEPFIRHRVEICVTFPDLFLEFVNAIQLVREDSLIPEGKNSVLLQDSAHFLTAGSTERSPARLWSHLLDNDAGEAVRRDVAPSDATASGHGIKTTGAPRKMSGLTGISSSGLGRPDANKYLKNVDSEGMQRVMVCSRLIPFKGAVGMSANGLSRPESTLLCLIARAASNQDEFTVFESLIVKAMLQFKWNAYAETIFKCKYFLDVLLLLCFTVFSYTAAQIDDMSSLNLRTGESWIAICSGLFAFIGGSTFLFFEIRQLLIDGSRVYFNSPGKYIDMPALGTQVWHVASQYHLVPPGTRASAKVLAAWTILLSVFKILNFSRGFESFGPLVRMIIKICRDTANFFVVLLFMLVGFAMAFSVAMPEVGSMKWLFLMITSGVYGFSDIVEEIPMASLSQVLLFQMLMFWAMLIMLNLLIAIMNSAYENVKKQAALEAMYEKASIIQDVERFWLPAIMRQTDSEDLFPTWLHLLIPTSLVASFEDQSDKNFRLAARENGAAQEPVVSEHANPEGTSVPPRAGLSATETAANTVSRETGELPTQEAVLEKWDDVLRSDSTDVFKKTAKVHALEATANGSLVVIQGEIETKKVYEKGDFIVCGPSGERQVMLYVFL